MNAQATNLTKNPQVTRCSTEEQAGPSRLLPSKRFEEIVSNQAYNHSIRGIGYNAAQETYRTAFAIGKPLGKPGQLVVAVAASPLALLRLIYCSIQAYLRKPDQVERDKLEAAADDLETTFRCMGQGPDFDIEAFSALIDELTTYHEKFRDAGMETFYFRVQHVANQILVSKYREVRKNSP